MFHIYETDDFAKRVAIYADQVNFSLQELADVSGRSKSSISRYCNAKGNPPPEVASVILEYLEQKLAVEKMDEAERERKRTIERAHEAAIAEMRKRLDQKDEEIAAKNHRIEHLELVLAAVHKEKRAATIASVICAIGLALALIF